MKKNLNVIFSLIINLIIIIMEILSFTLLVDKIGNNPFNLLAFYTYDSNIFLLLSSILISINNILILINKKESINKNILLIKYMSTGCVTLTFLIVIFVLIPLEGFESTYIQLISGNKVFLHLLCPILSIISFLIFERNPKLKFKDTFISVIPTFIYAIILIILNLLKVVDGPYPFLKVYDQSVYMSIIWVIVILGISYLICYLLFIIHRGKKKKIN